jgi:hypothetical protein
VICRTILAAILAAFMLAGGGAGTASAQEKDGVDLDCALLLCIPGGFPNDGMGICSASYTYMMQRLLAGKSPIGTCTTPDGSEFKDFSYSQGTHYYCDGGLTLAVEDRGNENGYRDLPDNYSFPFGTAGSAACYTKTLYKEYRCIGSYGRNGDCRYQWVTLYRYKQVSKPKGGRFISITISPGQSDAYNSGRIYY